MSEIIKAYKGFNPDMTCKGKQYKEGETYTESEADVCKKGMHACEYPLDCFKYYPPANSVYHEVEQSGAISRSNDDSKIASTEMKIGVRLDIKGLVNAAIEFTRSHCTMENTGSKQATAGDCGAATAGDSGVATAGDCGAATAGDCGAATAGDSGAATAGDCGVATAGDCGAATAGDSGVATAGYHGAATAGDCGAATAGDSGVATAGYHGAATAGDSGVATAGYHGAATAGDSGAAVSRGKSASGKNGLSVARGNDVKVKGGLGAVLVIAEEYALDYDIWHWKAAVVDGEKIKPDTWYKLEAGSGNFVECAEDE